MFSVSVAGGYRLVDSQEKATIGQSITALETAWGNLTADEKSRAALIVNGFILRATRADAFVFGCVNCSSSGMQIIGASSGLYSGAFVSSTGTVTYSNYSLVALGAAQLIVFN